MAKLLSNRTLRQLRAIEERGMLRSCTIARDGVTEASDVACALVLAGSAAAQPAAQALGGARGGWVGYLPWGTDLRDGDVITVDGREYAVLGAASLDTCVACALSEVGRG